MYQKYADVLIPYVLPLFRATFELDFFPDQRKHARTIVLKKPNKPDRTRTSAHRPIALMDTLGKILASRAAKRSAHETEKYGTLPEGRCGGKPGRSTTDALLATTAFITDAWNKGEAVVALFLDVKPALPSVNKEALMFEFKNREDPDQYVRRFSKKLENRRTSLRFDDHESPAFQTIHGIDQGCPSSPPVYIIYDSGLLDLPTRPKEMPASIFIDDASYLARGKTFEEATSKLVELLQSEGGTLDWAKKTQRGLRIRRMRGSGFHQKQRKTTMSRPTRRKCSHGIETDVQIPWTPSSALRNSWQAHPPKDQLGQLPQRDSATHDTASPLA